MSASSPTSITPEPRRNRYVFWLFADWILLCIWAVDAALVMSHTHLGSFTDHAADLALPAWLYVSFRRHRNSASTRWRRLFSNLHPAALAFVIFAASSATEICQRFWPRGLFAGTYDQIDVVAYGVGILVCFAADVRWQIPGHRPLA